LAPGCRIGTGRGTSEKCATGPRPVPGLGERAPETGERACNRREGAFALLGLGLGVLAPGCRIGIGRGTSEKDATGPRPVPEWASGRGCNA